MEGSEKWGFGKTNTEEDATSKETSCDGFFIHEINIYTIESWSGFLIGPCFYNRHLYSLALCNGLLIISHHLKIYAL